MKFGDNFFKINKEDAKKRLIVVYENDTIKHEVLEWIKHVGRENFLDILMDIGFKDSDTVYLYSNGLSYTEFYYSVNEDNANTEDKIKIIYGEFGNKGVGITIQNDKVTRHYTLKENNKFELREEEIRLSDKMKYTRHYYANSSVMWFNTNVDDKDYILKLSIFRNVDEDDILKLDNEMELEKYLCSLSLPCNLVDVFKRICEICKVDLNQYNHFGLELHKKNKRFKNESDVISDIKFINGEFKSISYIKDGKKINYKSSGDWSYEMIDDDDLVKLSIEVKNNKVDCKINSNSEGELDDYFQDLLLYDMSEVKNEIKNVKRLVRRNFNSWDGIDECF